MAATRKWLDKDYISNLKEVACFYAKSSMAGEFQNDEATVFSLLMRADAWGLHPDYVLQGCFVDQWGGIGYTGKLIKLVLEGCDDISSVKISEHGSWDKISKKYCCTNGNANSPTYKETWDAALASELGLTITVQFFDTTKDSIRYTVMLTDIDSTVKALNPNWITSPRTQLENVMLRDLAHTQLYQYVNAVGTDVIFESEESKHSDTSSITELEVLPKTDVRADTVNSPLAVANAIQKDMIREFTMCEDDTILKERLETSMDQLITIIKESGASLDDACKHKLKAIYQECTNLIHRQVMME